MNQSDHRTTLGDLHDAAEAELFVGRAAELAVLRRALTDARRQPAVLYIHGPAGVGKSSLLRAFRRLAEGRGEQPLLLDAAALDHTPEGFLQTLASRLPPLQQQRPAAFPSASAVAGAANRAAGGGLLILIDTYEELERIDRWLRAEVFNGFGPGVCLVLAGRLAPAELWLEEPAWQSVVQAIELGELSAGESLRFLQRRGINEAAACDEALRVCGGHPLLLTLAAGVLLQHQVESRGAEWHLSGKSEGEGGQVAAQLLEWLLRKHGASELADLLAAAALLLTFDRAVLTAMVGAAVVEAAWTALCELPVVRPVAGRYMVPDPVNRGILEATAGRLPPWVARRWRQRATEHHLRRAREGAPDEDGAAWAELSHLATDALWHSWLHPTAEREHGWRFERGARRADLPELMRCWKFGLRNGPRPSPEVLAAAPALLRRLLEFYPEGFIVARDAAGRIIGYHAELPLRPDTRSALLGQPSPGLYLQMLPPEVLKALEGRLLGLCQFGFSDVAPGLHYALLREVLRDVCRYDVAVGCTPEVVREGVVIGVGNVLPSLGFQRGPCVSDALPGMAEQPVYAWILDLSSIGYAEWLRRVVTPPTLAPLEGQRAAVAKEALAALHDPQRLERTAAAGYYTGVFGSPDSATLRAWLLDTLASADFPTAGASGREIVRRYYVERAGPHEAIAEQLDLPRTSYFRLLNHALMEFGAELLS